MTDSPPPTSTPAAETITELEAAADRVGDAEAAIADHGESAVETAADAYRNAIRLLESYADSATGTGDFGAYLRFQSQFLSLADSVPDDTLGYDGFQRASDRMDKRRLSDDDFAFARDALEPAGEAVAMLEERENAREAYRTARHAAKTRLDELRAEADRLQSLQQLGSVDLTTALDQLREPIEAYNEAVRAAFDLFRKHRSARALFALIEAAADRPLVDVDRPPRDLAEYIESAPAGTEPLATLREYADYSPSKLDHYVDDPGALRTHVAVHQTYLNRLGPEPFCIEWPPADAATLRARLGELAPIVRRLDSVFADVDIACGAVDADVDTDRLAVATDVAADRPDGSDTERDDTAADADAVSLETNRIEIARRTVSRLTRTDDYERLRRVAVARAELSADDLDRLTSGAVADDLAAVQADIESLETVLAETALDD